MKQLKIGFSSRAGQRRFVLWWDDQNINALGNTTIAEREEYPDNSTIHRWRNRRIFEMWMACYTQEQIAETVGCSRDDVRGVKEMKFGESSRLAEFPKNVQAAADHATDFEPPTISNWLGEKRINAEFAQPPASRQHFDIWQFPTASAAMAL